jgi:hypothetical protein
MASLISSLTYLLVLAAVLANRIALKITEDMYVLKQVFIHFRLVYIQMRHKMVSCRNHDHFVPGSLIFIVIIFVVVVTTTTCICIWRECVQNYHRHSDQACLFLHEGNLAQFYQYMHPDLISLKSIMQLFTDLFAV